MPPAQPARPARTSPLTALATGGALFAVILASFTGYAFFSRAVFRTSALVQLEDPKAVRSDLPEPLEAARKLREVTLDRQMLEILAEKIEPTQTPAGRVEMARRIRAATEVDTVDGKSYVIAFSDSDAERAQSICNQIASRAAERLPKVLASAPGTSPEETERQKRTERMMAFLAAHPDAWSAGDASTESKARANDPAQSALRVERDRLVADLARAQAAATEASSDNPYAESPTVKPDQLNARLREVDRALAARREALETAQPKPSKLSPELRDEWQKLVKDVAQAPAAPPPPPPLRARVAQRAVTPEGPISPNRRLLVGLGSVLGLFVGGLGAALTLGAQKAARKRQSAPPGPRLAASSAPPPTKTILNSTLVLDKPPEPIRPSTNAPKPITDTERAPAGAPEPYRMSSSVPPNFQAALEGGNFKIPPARVPSISPTPILPVAATPAKAFTPPPPVVSPLPIKPVAEASPAAGSEPPREAPAPLNGSEPTLAPPKGKSVPPPLPERKPPAVVAPAPEVDPAAAAPPRRETAAFEGPRPEARKPAPPLESIHPPFTPPNDDRARLERKVRATPKTLVLGSVIAPVMPASRSTPPPAPPSSTKQNLRGTGYSHVSSHPPGAEVELVQPRSVAPGWAPDPNVAPDSRRELCDKLFPLALERCFVIAVSGTPDSAESKSRVAAELAVSLAKSQHPRVLLLEGNRNRPAVHRLMRVDFAAEGLSRQLESRARGNAAPWTVKRCSETLDVLGEGLNRAPGMMLTPTFTTSVTELKGYYDFVVIDGPFLYDSADCKALAAVVDGVVLVCSDERARERVEQLSPFGVKRFQSVVPYSV